MTARVEQNELTDNEKALFKAFEFEDFNKAKKLIVQEETFIAKGNARTI